MTVRICLVRVPMVSVRKVPVTVRHHDMGVRMAVWLGSAQALGMSMLVMDVVHVFMRVLFGIVRVQVTMALGQVQPHTHRHQRSGHQQLGRDRLLQDQHAQQRTEERRDREVSPCSRRAQVPQRHDEQR